MGEWGWGITVTMSDSWGPEVVRRHLTRVTNNCILAKPTSGGQLDGSTAESGQGEPELCHCLLILKDVWAKGYDQHSDTRRGVSLGHTPF